MKKIANRIILLFASILGLTTVACRQNIETPSSEFTSYIKAYTGGLISGTSTIRIEFTDRITRPADFSEKPEELFRFSPSLKGQTVWSEDGSIEFIPENLVPGQNYKATFALDKVAVIDNPSLKKFAFTFSTMPREAVLNVDTPTIKASSPDFAIISGRITCSEPASLDKISQMLVCSAKTDINVKEGKGSGEYFFETGPIAKQEKPVSVDIRIEDKSKEFKTEGKYTVTIPPKEKFSIIGCRIVQGKEPYVLVSFSEPIALGTDLEGLVRLDKVRRFLPKVEDNRLKIYFERPDKESVKIVISRHIKNIKGVSLGEHFSKELEINDPKPAVEFTSEGNILPDAHNQILPFRAVNLSAVDISVIQIFENNVLTFLQENKLEDNHKIRRAGRLVYKKTLRLDSEPGRDLHKWQDFAVNIDEIFKREPGAIYRIRLSFKQEYSLYGKESSAQACASNGLISTSSGEMTAEEEAVWDIPSPYYYDNYRDWSIYQWKDRDNPMTPSYYMESDRMPQKNLLASNLGIIAKKGERNTIWLNVNDIVTTAPVSDAEITAYNYQLQEIAKSKTDKNGETTIEPDGKAFIVTARKGKTVSYLRILDGENKSTSRFDASGEAASSGLKGYAYGERGVWRPGDTLHVTLVLNDKNRLLPAEHPVTMELYTPLGQFYEKQINTHGKDGFYTFDIVTAPDSPTGVWNAYFKVGGSTFHKSLRIETIKPNRIKIRMPEAEGKILEPGEIPVDIKADWLTGPAAAGMKTTVEVTAKSAPAKFGKYKGYNFENPIVQYTPSTEKILETRTDGNGEIHAKASLKDGNNMPGPMKLTFVTKVQESAGDVSIVAKDYDFSPFKAYVGVKMPESDTRYLTTDQDNIIDVITVDKNGKALKGRALEYKIYKLEWSWWWENRSESLDAYVNNSSVKPYRAGTLTSSATGNKINLRIEYPEWGRFLVCVRDIESGHLSGGIAMVDWPSWRGRSDKKNPDALTMLSFSLDKKSYEVGEDATVFIPAAKDGRALVSLENGSGVIDRKWVRTTPDKEVKFTIRITEKMAPNFYVHISLLQPYGNLHNDTPIRMYGVQPVEVTNKNSRLHPVISSPEVIRPQEKFKIKVSERDGRDMTYTLAIVDEGLLDITSFKTPDPWGKMYAKEALGVSTWDLYDNILGTSSGRFSSMFAIGGDESFKKPDQRDKRFNPVVKFMGPFSCGKGGRTHEITLPMYVGSVRIMVVAGKEGSYGNAEKTVPVRSPLMILPTLPRVLSTGDLAVLPVNVFALEDNIKDVKVSVSCKGAAEVTSSRVQNLKFEKTGDKICRFNIRTKDTAVTENHSGTDEEKSVKEDGSRTAEIVITAEGGGFKVKEQISIDIKNPQPYITHSESTILNGKESKSFSHQPFVAGQNEWVKLDISGFPAIDFENCMEFAIGYRYDCSEQLAAIGLTILSLRHSVSEETAETGMKRIPEILRKLYGRQMPDGGFAYWPGAGQSNEWVTSMVGEFMIRAVKEGFEIDNSVLLKWKKYQQRQARNFRTVENSDGQDLTQAYRLYTLAIAAEPENGAMNRLKENSGLSRRAAVRLASAYSLCGKRTTAVSLLERAANQEAAVQRKVYDYKDITFGSTERDIADRIEAATLIEDIPATMFHAGKLSESMSGDRYFNTQTLAFASKSLAMLEEKIGNKPIEARISDDNGSVKEISTVKSHVTSSLRSEVGRWTVTNDSDATCYVRFSIRRQADAGETVEKVSSGISLTVNYIDENGKIFSPLDINQGKEFSAEIKVTNTTGEIQKNLVLDYRIPAGWEIYNESLFAGTAVEESPSDHKDIRDDGSVWFFDLQKGETKTFKVRMMAAYEGRFILPATVCEAMYNPHVRANSSNGTVVVRGL